MKVLSCYCGMTDRLCSENPFYSLTDALMILDKLCFFTVGCYTVAIIRYGNMFYIFDSHSRSECGMPCPDSKAILTGHSNLSSLMLFIRHLCSKLFSNCTQYFEVTHIAFQEIQSLPTMNESNTSSSEFSGFSDMSDGEYACRLFLIQERQKTILDNMTHETMTKKEACFNKNRIR